MLEFKVYKNKVLTPKLTIKSLDGELFKIKSIRSALGCVRGIYDPDKSVKEATIGFRLNLENAKMLFNPKGTLTVKLEHADFKEIMLEYCVRPPLSITPSQITEFSVEHKKPFMRTVALRKEANIDSSLEIISLEIDTVTAIGDSGVNIKHAEQTEEGCDITLEIFPPSPGKNKNSKYETDQLVIWFKDGNKVAIPIRYMFK